MLLPVKHLPSGVALDSGMYVFAVPAAIGWLPAKHLPSGVALDSGMYVFAVPAAIGWLPAKHLPSGVALEIVWCNIGWEGEAFMPHLPSSPVTDHRRMHLLWEGVSLERNSKRQDGTGF